MNAQDIRELLAELASIDFETVPSIRFVAMLRDKLAQEPAQRFGWSAEDIEFIVLSMNVDLGMVELTDEDIDAMTTSFCTVIVKMAAAMQAKGFVNTAGAMRLAAPRLSLKLS